MHQAEHPGNEKIPGLPDVACSRLRDSGEKSFSKKKCSSEIVVRSRSVKRNAKKARGLATAPFPKSRALIFALLVVIRPHYIISESLAQASRMKNLQTLTRYRWAKILQGWKERVVIFHVDRDEETE